MLFGLDLVAAEGRNISVNGALVPEKEPLLRKGEGGSGRGPCKGIQSKERGVPCRLLGHRSAGTWGARLAAAWGVHNFSLPCPLGSPPPGISIWWLGDFLFVESGLGVRVKFDGHSTVYVTVGTALQGTTQGLCGIYNDNPAGDSGTRGHLASVLPTPNPVGLLIQMHPPFPFSLRKRKEGPGTASRRRPLEALRRGPARKRGHFHHPP